MHPRRPVFPIERKLKMSRFTCPEGYKSALSLYETQSAIEYTKRIFESRLCDTLDLMRVSAPLFVDPDSGINDDLNGTERPVRFDIPDADCDGVVVHSLAKWKRMALWRYGFKPGKGLYTDMNAIRRDEELDNLHSVYTDQWDWEKVITPEQRNESYLIETVKGIVKAIAETGYELHRRFPVLPPVVFEDVSFVTTQQLEDLYPELTPKQRENEYLRRHKAAFIMQIGGKLRSGVKHDGRAPDYDDWSLNGDIMFWNELLGCAFEVSSMGIRVDAESLDSQLAEAGAEGRKRFLFHRLLLDGTLPLTMGGGIGQSRLCMLLLQKAHIGEVQCSIWDDVTRAKCDKAGIALL